MYHFKVYIVDSTPKSKVSLENLKRTLDSQLGTNNYNLEVIDILKNAYMAEKDKIFATPTVVRVNPQPTLKLIGNIDNPDNVIKELGLKEAQG